jgi:biotin-(acetyl-CoA carboxylase) ligase
VGRADHVIEGVFETIDADGRLILATPSGRTALEAGDVFPSGAALTNG